METQMNFEEDEESRISWCPHLEDYHPNDPCPCGRPHGDEEELDVWLEADWDDGYDPEDDIDESDIIQAPPMNFESHSNR